MDGKDYLYEAKRSLSSLGWRAGTVYALIAIAEELRRYNDARAWD